MDNILIIDDEQNIRIMLKDILRDEGFNTFEAKDWNDGRKVLLKERIDVLLLDICLPKTDGMEVLGIVKKEFSGLEVIIISGHGNIDLAVRAIKNGAFDFISKPLSIEKMFTIIHNALTIKRLKEENESLKASTYDRMELIGDSQLINNVKDKIINASKSDARVLITGENGTGKELVARAIHFHSVRKEKPFIAINCAAIPENLIESELFGYEKGAFTGATTKKKGKFELANNGTIFLDEIADMSLNTQAKVLRVLEEMNFERVGGVSTIKVDIRVISATNKNILEEIENDNFREDLYYRINVIPIHVPSLRDRKEDIPLLIEYFMEQFAKQGAMKKKILTEEAIKLLKEYPWNGNIRELKNIVERLYIMIEERNISDKHIKYHVYDQTNKSKINEDIYKYSSLKTAKEMFEKKFISKKLIKNEMNISKTAKELEIERSNLHKKIKKYSL